MSLKDTGHAIKETIEAKLHHVELFVTTKLAEIKSELEEQHHMDYRANLAAFEEKWKNIGHRVHSVEHVAAKLSPKLEHDIEEQFQADYMTALEAFQRKWKDEIEKYS
ncbi:MAG: hypothetical protein VXZ35_07235 [Pseudomonadota bacterium]|nr:hypothetical protein [Pseudomonadota bacterium]